MSLLPSMLGKSMTAALGAVVLAATAPGAEPPPEREPRRIALLVGIADYAYMGATPTAAQPLADLQGPENDVLRMRTSLRTWGFTSEEDLRVLTGRAATKAGLEAGFQWAASRATDPADVVVIYYSGHGSHAPDADGDEPDGRDEGLVPFDAEDSHDPAQLLLDDQVRGFLAGMRTENVTVIIDACYSGTVTRGAGDVVARDKGPRPPASGATPDAAGTGDFTEARGHTLITAARSDQTAQELPFDVDGQKVWIGAMTYHLTRALDGAAGAQALRYDELIERLRADVRGALLPQVPQLEGDAGAVLFRANQGAAARPFVVATALPGGRVAIDAGAVHGVRNKSVYDVHGAGELRFDATPVARVAIDSVEASRAFGVVVDESMKPVTAAVRLPDAARAVPSLVPVGAPAPRRLGVHVDASAASLAAGVRADSTRFVLADSATADATLTQRRGVPEVLVRGVSLPPQSTDSTVAATFQGRRVTGYAPEGLSCPLLRALSITNLERLDNPAPPGDLAVLARLVRAGTGAPRTDESKVDTVYIGEPVDVYVKVAVTADLASISRLYMTAALAGYTSSPAVLWPQGDVTPFPLNRWVPIMRNVTVDEPGGSEILKVVVNSDPYDLTSLVQAFGACPGTRGLRGDWTSKMAPVTGWMAVSHRVDILRR